ncbi:hypothetical protein [Winogradskyella sp. A3E31]|uniref:hypothetical protein n=1 Tax=Winogradskyella sp. A3E31 TaxID=3349637 RepID=UPI00398B7C94
MIFAQDSEIVLTNLEMNTKNPHFGMALGPNGKILITSFKTNKKGRVIMDGIDPVLGLYEGNVEPSGEITDISPVEFAQSEDIEHIVSATYSPDGKKLYVTTKYGKRKNKPKGNFKETNLHIEVAEYIEGKGWSNFTVLPFCNPKFSYAHPSISADGKTMYFISSVKGQGSQFTRGKSDIYKVTIDENGSYSEPENVGINVNSYAQELFPFISRDNTLYFASSKPGGMGSYDIYKSEMDDEGNFKKAEHLSKPINSTASDICFVMVSDKTGYVTSKRKSGKGDDDIYYFVMQ